MDSISTIDTAWISIITAFGAFATAILSIWLGYRLFVIGATGGFKFRASASSSKVGLESVAPGIAFAAFGMFIALLAVYKLIGD